MFKTCCLVSQNANFSYMVRKKEYKKVVAQQNCVFEQRLKDKPLKEIQLNKKESLNQLTALTVAPLTSALDNHF